MIFFFALLLFFASFFGRAFLSPVDAYEKIRNPFVFVEATRDESKRHREKIVLVGIVSCSDKQCVVLACGDETCVLEKGEMFEGYQLTCIGGNMITLCKGKKEKKLYAE